MSVKNEGLFTKPFKLFGIEFAPLSLPMERRLQTLGAFIWSGTIVIGFPTSCIVFFYFLWNSQYHIIILPYLAWYIFDFRTPFKGGLNVRGKLCQYVRNLKIWKHFKNYFPSQIIKTADLDPQKNYLLGCHPHGFYTTSSFTSFDTNDKDFQELYPNMNSRVMVSSNMFLIPFMRELTLSFGCVSCLKNSMEIVLNQGQGMVSALVVGGAMEAMNLGHRENVKLYLEKRKGFVKMAIRTGADLIPSFTFGENQLYHQFEHPTLKKIQLFFERLIGFVPLFFIGRGIFQYSFGFLPRRIPLNIVIGKPIPVVKDPNPSREIVEKVHRTYINELKELYEKYSPLYGDSKIKLIVE